MDWQSNRLSWHRGLTWSNLGPVSISPWWRHQMETFSALLALCAGIHRSPVNSPHKVQWCGALMSSLIFVWINGWVNNREADHLRRHRAHYDIMEMIIYFVMSSHEVSRQRDWVWFCIFSWKLTEGSTAVMLDASHISGVSKNFLLTSRTLDMLSDYLMKRRHIGCRNRSLGASIVLASVAIAA